VLFLDFCDLLLLRMLNLSMMMGINNCDTMVVTRVMMMVMKVVMLVMLMNVIMKMMMIRMTHDCDLWSLTQSSHAKFMDDTMVVIMSSKLAGGSDDYDADHANRWS
jgi:hypothetical protein